MPRPGYCWWHLILNTRGSWLHGDPRGFRSRGHRIHSSGDYKQPPPDDEHAKLHGYHMQRSKDAVVIPQHLFAVVGQRIVDKAHAQEHELLALCSGKTHVHALVSLANDYHEAKRVMSSWKQASSHAVRETLPGRIWAAGGVPIRVAERSHQLNVYRYILGHAEKEGAWVCRKR